MTTPLLELTALEPDRPTVLVRTKADPKGTLYELASLEDFGLIEQARLARQMREAVELGQALVAAPVEPTGDPETDGRLKRLRPIGEPEARRYIALLDDVVASIFRAPPDVRAMLSEPQKLAIIEAFPATVTGAATPDQTDRPSTSAGSTSGSPPSTAPAPG